MIDVEEIACRIRILETELDLLEEERWTERWMVQDELDSLYPLLDSQ